jgi:beta-lactamase superfamily II metal-dependent hydrolase
VLITHADADHLAGLVALLGESRYAIGRVVLNTDSAKDTDMWHALLFELDDQERQGSLEFDVALVEGDEPFQSGEITVEVLAPRRRLAAIGPGGTAEDGRPIRTNTISAVVRIQVGDRPVALIASDLDDVGLDELLDTDQDLETPILVYPHHGGRSGATTESEFANKLLEAVKPQTVIFSTGRAKHRNPLPEVIQAVRAAGADIRIGCTQLSRNCAHATPESDPTHLLPLAARGRATRACCGGTFRIDLADRGSLLQPAHAHHLEFIVAAAPTALCTQ